MTTPTNDDVVRLLGEMAEQYRSRHSLHPDAVLILTCPPRKVRRVRAALAEAGHDHVVVVPRARVGWAHRLFRRLVR